MLVDLTSARGSRISIKFNPSAKNLDWRTQSAGTRFIVRYDPGVGVQVPTLFVKHWLNGKATAHDLMMARIGKKVRGTPDVMGFAGDATGEYYFLESLPKSYHLISDLLSAYQLEQSKGNAATHARQLIAHTPISQVVSQAADTLCGIWESGYVYADFGEKNMLIHRFSDIQFIDVDSCEKASSSFKQPSTKFDLSYWILWKSFIKSERCDVRLPKSMLLSIGAVWTRALALSRDENRLIDAVTLLCDKRSNLSFQHQLWNALDIGNSKVFNEQFMLPTGSSIHFDRWRRLFHNLKGGDGP